MTTFTETLHAGHFIVSEANGHLSRESVTIDTGVLVAGTVLGRITATGKYVILAPSATDGSQTAAAILFDDADASAADVTAVAIVRLAEVIAAALVWPDGITAAQKSAALATLGASPTFIVAR